jgi:glucose-6-phosphate 1-dehydrogenase
VPFYIRTGKRLPKKATEIAIQFRATPHTPFARGETRGLEPNVLVLRIQPEEGISLKIGAKVQGSGFEVSSVNMDLLYGTAFLEEAPDAYQRLLLDLMLGDPTLFIRADEAEGAWSILEPLMHAWSEKGGLRPTRREPGDQKRPRSSSGATDDSGGARDRGEP